METGFPYYRNRISIVRYMARKKCKHKGCKRYPRKGRTLCSKHRAKKALLKKSSKTSRKKCMIKGCKRYPRKGRKHCAHHRPKKNGLKSLRKLVIDSPRIVELGKKLERMLSRN